MQIIKIPATLDDFFIKYVTLVIKPVKRLTDKETRILAELLRMNHEKKAIPVEDRDRLLFSIPVRKELMDKLKIPKASFHNSMKCLRDKGCITYGTIVNQLRIDPDVNNAILLKFNINGNRTEGSI